MIPGGTAIAEARPQASPGQAPPPAEFVSVTVDNTVTTSQTGSWTASITGSMPSGSNLLGGVFLGPTPLAAAGIVPAASTTSESNHIFKTSSGNLYGVDVLIGATAGFLMLFNAVSAPTDGAVAPIKCYPVQASASFSASFSPPLYCSTGIVAVFSTQGPFVKSASATAFFSGQVA